MSLIHDPSLRERNDCGCCEGLTARTPLAVVNRPGLSAVAYRIGTHAEFKRSLLAALSDSRRLPLQRLNTRDDDDFSIALLDAWATVADVLTFYQERIANESYLRTATERLSIVELARAIGYELTPGVAASAYLAFTLEDGRGAPGYATIDQGTKVQSLPGPGERPQTFETIETIQARAAWNAIKPQQTTTQTLSAGMTSLLLQGADLNLKPGDMLLILAADGRAMRRIATVRVDHAAEQTTVTLEPPGVTAATATGQRGVWALRVKAAPFGHNAALQAKLSTNTSTNTSTVTYDEWALAADDQKTKVLSLDAVYDRIQTGSWVVIDRSSGLGGGRVIGLIDNVQPSYRADYGLAGPVTELTLHEDWFAAPLTDPKLKLLRGVVVYAQSEPLTLAAAPLQTAVEGKIIPLNGAYEGLAKGRTVIFTGKLVGGDDTTVSEEAALAEVTDSGGLTTLTLERDLANHYRRDTVTIAANVALATHGETQREVLGSGDAGQSNQRFTLRQSPLTYVPAETPSGGRSTLEVRVNDLLWTEAPTHFGRGPRDRVYVTRRDEEGKTTVQFGDGRAGARLPSGQENVKAVYRHGIGREGQVKAEQLSLLMTRPLGVNAVTNPRPATGAADPQETKDARRNAPLTVLTLGRIVSLEDYADFARGFAGIAKALATWTWNGDARGVLVTVAGEDGDIVVDGGPLHTKLVTAMSEAADPRVPLQVKSYFGIPFRIAARVLVDRPTYREADVLAAVRAALQTRFSFEAREFGQSVALSEIITVIQDVPGVVAVDVDRLYRGGTPERSPLLTAFVPPPGAHAETVEPAELLTLDPASLENVEALP